jgi:hypothetical protein
MQPTTYAVGGKAGEHEAPAGRKITASAGRAGLQGHFERDAVAAGPTFGRCAVNIAFVVEGEAGPSPLPYLLGPTLRKGGPPLTVI